MKHYTFIFIALFLLIPVFDHIKAQEIDTERMNRDIRIMEQSLSELFRVENQQHFSINIPGFSLGGGTASDNIKGNYIHGYGIIFSIPDIMSKRYGFINWTNTDEPENNSLVFSNKVNGSDDRISEESVKDRITEFLTHYAPTIGQLSNENRITVVYGSEFYNESQIRFRTGRIEVNHLEDRRGEPMIPVIAMSVSKSDLDALRSGSIQSSEFESRITTEIISQDDQSRTDLNIFANILETELSQTQNELFKLNRKPAYLHLDDFGVIYRIDFSRYPAFYIGNVLDNISIRPFEIDLSDSMNFFRFNQNEFHIDLDSLGFQFNSDLFSEENREKLRLELDATKEKFEETRNRLHEQMPEILEKQDRALERALDQQRNYRLEIERQRELSQDPDAVLESLERNIQIIKELMIDYGRTLSLNSNQSILISVHIPEINNMNLPHKINLTISKNLSNQFESGAITREQALERIQETRF
jgi:hypothetical protein